MRSRCGQKLIDLANVTPESVAEQSTEISLLPPCHVPKDKAEAFRSWQPEMGNSKNELSDHRNLRGKGWLSLSSKSFCSSNVTELL